MARSHFYESVDGLRLHIRVHGVQADTTPVVCLPGLTRNARDFEALADLIVGATPARLVAVFDYRGRGLSDRDRNPRNYNIATEAQDVLAGLSALGIDRAAFIGTSRGGLIVHHLAKMQPALINAVVLNDIGPELGIEGLAQIQRYLAASEAPNNWREAVARQKQLHGAAFPALTDGDWLRFTRALYREGEGRPVLDFDPALVDGLVGLDLTQALPDLWGEFASLAAKPLLVVRGEHSRLLTPEIAEAMRQRHPAAEFMTAYGQGHAPLLELGELPRRIRTFLDDFA